MLFHVSFLYEDIIIATMSENVVIAMQFNLSKRKKERKKVRRKINIFFNFNFWRKTYGTLLPDLSFSLAVEIWRQAQWHGKIHRPHNCMFIKSYLEL